jgi:hypothetical protein
MRRPIRSNVIQRRMFNGGMGMTKPGAPVASGILASSQPLVDVLASQARDNLTNGINVGNQMYGSNVQGTNLMNQGGVANYSPGGISYGVDASGQVSVPVSGSIDEIKEQSTEEKVGLSKIEKIKNWFSNQSEEIANTQDVYSANILAEELSQKANTLMEKTGWDIYKGPLGITGEVIKKIATYPYEVLDSAFSIEAIPTDATKRDAANKDLLESEEIQQNKVPVDEVEEKLTELQSSNMTNIPDKSEAIDMLSITNGMSLVPEDKKSSSDDNKNDAEEITTESDTDQVTDDISLTGESESILTDKILETSEDKKATVKTIEQYKEEFLKAMPEYEGMSDEEKGNAWIKMGMAIAAGQSPNTITNIANGVLSTIDDFADDPKQKREFKMKVALAASKYAVQNVNNDRTVLKTFETNEKDLVYLYNPATNMQKTITKAELRAGSLPEGFLVSQDPMGDAIKATNAAKNLLEAETANMIANAPKEIDSTFSKMGPEYQKAALQVIGAQQGKMILGPAIEILYNEGTPINGIEGVMNQTWNRMTNALGIDKVKDRPEGVWSKIKDDGRKREEYVGRMKIVIAKKITAILGESNKTISDGDRKRVDDIAGMFADYWAAGIVADPEIMKMKIQSLYETLNTDENNGRATMNGLLREIGNLAVPGGAPFSARESMLQRGVDIGVGKKGISAEGKIVDYNSMFDIEGNLLQ